MSTESLISSTLEENEDRPQPPAKMGSLVPIIIISSIGIVAAIVGLSMGSLWSTLIDRKLSDELVLTSTSKSYSLWKETPVPMYLELYLYNWTNPEEFHANSTVKPHFIEMGPYVFEESDIKANIVWNDNATVTFQQQRVWHFKPERSNGSLFDNITNVNPVATSVVYMMRYKLPFIKRIINSVLKFTHENLTVTKTVRELLFDGYEDEFLDRASKLNSSMIPFDKFGWFYTRNNSASYDGTFNMLTGATRLSDLGSLREWNYSNKSKYYSDTCNPINGSLGDLWAPNEYKESLEFFAPDVCTSMNLVYEGEAEHSQVTGRKYISNKDMLDNGTIVKSRACYCKDVECVPNGAFNVSQCKFNAPAFISLPHFYLADDYYREQIDGMNPRKEDHEFSITIEPVYGIPLEVRARLQLNLLIQPDEMIDIFRNVRRTFIPILWFTQRADLSGPLVDEVKFFLTLPMLGHVTLFGVAAIGFLLLIIGTGLFIRRSRRADDGQVLIPKNEANGTERADG